jgi:hypothetical protein
LFTAAVVLDEPEFVDGPDVVDDELLDELQALARSPRARVAPRAINRAGRFDIRRTPSSFAPISDV